MCVLCICLHVCKCTCVSGYWVPGLKLTLRSQLAPRDPLTTPLKCWDYSHCHGCLDVSGAGIWTPVLTPALHTLCPPSRLPRPDSRYIFKRILTEFPYGLDSEYREREGCQGYHQRRFSVINQKETKNMLNKELLCKIFEYIKPLHFNAINNCGYIQQSGMASIKSSIEVL